MVHKQTLILAHRGAAHMAPENTLASFQHALRQGCDGIELDVHLTRDERIVVCHDASIDRTTDGSGLIANLTAGEIKRYDAGSWFSAAFRGERIPLLEEVFAQIPPRILLNIEMKHSYSGYLEKALLSFLRRSTRLDQVVVSSFNHSLLQKMKWEEAKLKVGLLYPVDYLGNYTSYAKRLGIDVYSLHPHFYLLNRTDVITAAKAGYNVYPYTVDSVKEVRRMLRYNVSGIITNRPNMAHQARRLLKR